MPVSGDLEAVRSILRTDPGWAAYALADLAPGYREHAEWHIGRPGAPAVALVYRGFHPPVLFALGGCSELRTMVAEIARERELALSVPPEVPAVLASLGFEIVRPRLMWRMVLDPGAFPAQRGAGASRLGPADAAALRELYADGDAAGEAPECFQESMLREGVYFGIREGDRLVAAAGTHVHAPGEGVAAIGNVYTHQQRRGRGYGESVTAAVAAALLRQGLDLVVLNVRPANAAAIAVYRRLGFRHHCDFVEGLAVKS